MRFKETKLFSLCTQLEKESSEDIWSYKPLYRAISLHAFPGCRLIIIPLHQTISFPSLISCYKEKSHY